MSERNGATERNRDYREMSEITESNDEMREVTEQRRVTEINRGFRRDARSNAAMESNGEMSEVYRAI